MTFTPQQLLRIGAVLKDSPDIYQAWQTLKDGDERWVSLDDLCVVSEQLGINRPLCVPRFEPIRLPPPSPEEIAAWRAAQLAKIAAARAAQVAQLRALFTRRRVPYRASRRPT
jgi:hypothetical protein